MIFKQYPVVENKLSEKLSDNNILKKVLQYMEEPSKQNYVYSFISFFLLFYIWAYLFAMLYEHPYGYEYTIFPVIWATFSFFLGYKKNNILVLDKKTKRTNDFLLVVLLLYCIVMFLMNPRANIITDDVKNFVIFFDGLNLKEFNNNTYVCLISLAFFTIGFVFSYCTCSYYLYRGFYSSAQNNPNWKHMLRKYTLILIVGFLLFLFTTEERNKGLFSYGGDFFTVWVRSILPFVFLGTPILFISIFRTWLYIGIGRLGLYFNGKK